MPRTYANIRIDMWGSPEWRKLSSRAQWLYMYLLSSPTLNYVGVSRWQPINIASRAHDETPASVEDLGRALEEGRFVFIDREHEEVLIRSFLRHDGVLENPNLWRSVGIDFAATGSEYLAAVVAMELRKLRTRHPAGMTTAKGKQVNPWDSKHLQTALDAYSETPSPPAPSNSGRESVASEGGTPSPPATAPTPSSKEDRPAKAASAQPNRSRGTRIEESWRPSSDDIEAITKDCPGYNWEAEHQDFIDYWLAKPGKDALKIEWGRTWRRWMRKNYNDMSPQARQTMTARKVRRFNDVDE